MISGAPRGAHFAPKWLPNGIKKITNSVTFRRSGPEGVLGWHLGSFGRHLGVMFDGFGSHFRVDCGGVFYIFCMHFVADSGIIVVYI